MFRPEPTFRNFRYYWLKLLAGPGFLVTSYVKTDSNLTNNFISSNHRVLEVSSKMSNLSVQHEL